MADGKVIYEISGDNSGFKKTVDETENMAQDGAGKITNIAGLAAKAFTALAAAAIVKGLVDVGKASVEAYADYEQLVGGVETLFKDSADAVQNYANEAYKTAGLSANQYMEQVTGFSASLLQSLGGDTAAAADYANAAVIDMADNANKMGTAIESIQNAYSGFAKGNFTMLDNLKLGYGGTKEEMERLLADAEKISGIHYDLSSFADITQAIHVIQEEMGIAGATAEEASTTIQGSFGMVAAAWQNLLTGMSDKEADLNGLISNLIDSITTAADNVIPVIVEGFGTHLPEVIQMGFDLVNLLVTTIIENLPMVVETALQVILSLMNGIAENIPVLIPTIVDVVLQIVQTLIDNVGMLVEAAVAIIIALAQGLINALPQLIEKAPEIIASLVKALIKNGPTLVKAGVDLIKMVVQGIGDMVSAFFDVGGKLLEGLKSGILNKAKAVKDAVVNSVKGAWESAKKFLGINSPSKLFMQVGTYVDEGFAEGIENSAEAPKRSIRQMLGGITDVSVPTMPTATPAMAGPAIVNTETTGSRGAAGGNNTIVMQVGRIPFGQVTYNSNQEENTVHGVNYIARR